jgi:ABC-type glucose/galactose transport system permease subunit
VVLAFVSNVDWIKVILASGKFLHIPKEEHHYFQIFAAVACDFLWTSWNKAYHEGISINALSLSLSTD